MTGSNTSGAYESWQRDARSAFMWGGAAAGSLGTTLLHALTAWYMALLCGLVYLVGAVVTYRRTFVAPFAKGDSREVAS